MYKHKRPNKGSAGSSGRSSQLSTRETPEPGAASEKSAAQKAEALDVRASPSASAPKNKEKEKIKPGAKKPVELQVIKADTSPAARPQTDQSNVVKSGKASFVPPSSEASSLSKSQSAPAASADKIPLAPPLQDQIKRAPPPPPLPSQNKGPPPAPPPPSQIEDSSNAGQSDGPSPLIKGLLALPFAKNEAKTKKIVLNPNDLLTQKRLLKKIDRKTEFHPVNMSRKELFEAEYEKTGETPPEYLPLNIVKPAIVSESITADLVMLNFNGIDQLTDCLFPLLYGGQGQPSAGNFINLKKLLLVGCINLTDQALIWIGRVFPNLQMVELNACRKITEKGIHHLCIKCNKMQNLQVMSANLSLIPDAMMDSKLPQGNFQWAGCPVITQGRGYYATMNDIPFTHQVEFGDQDYFVPQQRKLVILRDSSLKETVTPLLAKCKDKKDTVFCYHQSLAVPSIHPSQPQHSFNILETAASSPLQDVLVTEGTIVMLPYLGSTDKYQLTKTAERLADIIASVIIKCSDVVFLLVEISDSGKPSDVAKLIKERLEYLVGSLMAATYDLYKRTWHLENLDFKGQQGVGWGMASLDSIEHVLDPGSDRLVTLSVTRENFQSEVVGALSKSAASIKKHVPWVHTEWSNELPPVIDKIPRSGAITQASLFHATDVDAKEKDYKRYSYPRLGKMINLLQNWGEALYHWHQHKSLCVTNVAAYEMLCSKFISTQPPDRVNVSCLGGEVPCWKFKSIESLIAAEKLDVKASDVIDLLRRQGMLLPVKEQASKGGTACQKVYIRMGDIPNDHDILASLWPEPCPVNRTLQTNRCYNFLPTVPPGFMPKLLRTLLKVYQPLYIWKSGFFLRLGPVDIIAKMLTYKGANLDKTPVLVLSARVVDLHLESQTTTRPDFRQFSLQARKVLFSTLKQIMNVVDFVCMKVKVYGCITMPCPGCAGYSMEGMTNLKDTWHLPYYIALASKHRGCKKHKSVTAQTMCDIQEEAGEGILMPMHNYPYHTALSTVMEEAIKSDRHRPLDPTERCFLCGSSLEIPCHHCTMCSSCIKQFTKFIKVLQPGYITSKSFKLQMMREGELKDDERIVSNTKGSVYYYKKGHRMRLLPVMMPFYWDEISITILRGANIVLDMHIGADKKLEYHGTTGTFVDQNGKSTQNPMWKSRDANVLNIKLESAELLVTVVVIIGVGGAGILYHKHSTQTGLEEPEVTCFKQIGKKLMVIISLKGLEVHREVVDGWHVTLDMNSQKPGMYIIHTTGLKQAWLENERSFSIGSTLEVTDDENNTHPAVIVEKSPEGYLTLDMNGVQKQYIFTSPQLMPVGTTAALGSVLASALPPEPETADNKTVKRQPVPLSSFLLYQVPCGFEALMSKPPPAELSNPLCEHEAEEARQRKPTDHIAPCTSQDYPSVWHAKQVQLRDKVESVLFSDGQWNYSTTGMLLMPDNVTKNDLYACAQQKLAGKFRLHPICYFRADVNSVMTSSPSAPQLKTLECFHNVHTLDNTGIELDNLSKEQAGESGSSVLTPGDRDNAGISLLWAWTLMLLRLQNNSLPQTKLAEKLKGVSSEEMCQGYRQVIQTMNHALFLTMGKDFDFASTVTEMGVERWKELILKHGESQGLVKVKVAFTDEIIFMCETHQATWQLNNSLEKFTGLPGPYSCFIYSLNLSCNSLTELPAEVFTGLPNLKDLGLNCNKLETLASEIGLCTQLVTLSMEENCLKELPSSLEKCQELQRLSIDKNSFTEFPAVILKLKNLRRLYAQYLHLQSLPDNIGDLQCLENLSLNGNCFTSLPDSMRHLQKLIYLSLSGVMWMKVRSNILLSKDHFEEFLKSNNLHQWLNHHNQDKSSIFRLFDEDTNGTLDPKEIGKLNATMFHVFPRFGYKGREPPDDDTPSGFPEVLCELSNLQYLSLQYHGLVSVPESIKKLTKLQTLHLGNNPNLLTISAQLGSLPLKRLELEGCPRLKTPPKEIRAKGFMTTFAYLKRLLSGSVSCQRTKLMLVGLGGAGKTSLVKALLSGNKRVQLTVGEEITDGIDICPWTVSTEDGNVTYSVWDFAGQTVYYNTHQFFLSDRAVYLLLWNIRLGHEHAGLSFWLSSISVHAPKAPILVVGTHLDQVSKVELPMREMQAKYPQICGFHFVSSHTGQGVSELQEHMLEVTLKQQYMGEKIPGVWLGFEESIKSIQDKSVIEYKELESRANRSGIFDSTEVVQAVQFLHELGSLQHFTNANLKSHVVINPQWIVDVMACVVSVKDSHIKDGRLNHADVAKVWKDYEPALHQWMLKLTEEFDLTFPLKDEKVNLVPCLLPEKAPEFEWPEPDKKGYNKEAKTIYKFDYLPAGLFNRTQVRLHQFCDSSLIWKRGSYLKKNGHVCLMHQSKESELTVKAYGPRPDNIVLLVHEVIETLILESFQGITYDYYLPCPDCMKLAVKDPHMFAASIIRRATELKAPFLQCLKYFHTVSITDLHAIMPPDSSQDFDLHLVQAVRGMKELQQDLAADVFVCLCSADEEKKHEETVLPSRVIQDVEKAGYKCWMMKQAGVDTTDEMAKALLDAKIFLVFMSNNFVLDETCCNLFKYARLTLRKPLILVAVGDNFNWKQSNMGILMADEVFINMTKASRYTHKFEELDIMLKEKQATKETKGKKKQYPPCFISYSWQNSAQAVAKGSRTTTGAVGYGDPRAIKDYLESKGIKCWIDVERVGVHGLFEDIGEGLINSRVVVVCISDQYAASDNCTIEFRYAVNTLKLPVILAVVGTGNKWRASELGILSLNYPLVSFQERSNNAMDKLLELVKEHLPTQEEKELKEEPENKQTEEKSKKEEQQKLSFQELCELAQRKFLRQISQYADRLDSVPYPNIMLVDFLAEEKGQDELPEKQKDKENAVDGSVSTVSNISSPRSSSGTGNFYDQQFCVYLLCEHEEGWHVSGNPIPLDAKFGHIIEQYLPYIARITAIAKYSKKLVLNSLASDIGRSYLKWLEENPSVTVTTDFQESYGALRQMVQDADKANSMGKLERCILPSGKYTWLCEAHRKAMKVTILTRESNLGTVHHQSEAMGVDYMVQALQDLDLNFLPQRLQESLQADAETSGRKKSAMKKSEVQSNSSNQASSSLSPSTNERPPLTSRTSIMDVSGGKAEEYSSPQQSGEGQRPSSQQQRPSLTRSNTKSRACLLM